MAYISFQPKDHFNTKIYTGTGSENAITGINFRPDWVWIKSRASANHRAFDAVRGATKAIYPSLSNAEGTAAQELKSFDSDGFTLGTESNVNANSTNFVSWNWKLGTTSGITTNGSTTITPTAYSFNATSGMSAIKCAGTGAAGLFPHGLGVAPRIVITKDLTNSNSWFVQTDLINSWTASNYLVLNTTAAVGTNTGIVNATDATNVSLYGSDDWVNASGRNYIHYCFTEKTGFSKFGTYVGNASASDNAFVYCGFKPAWVMTKCSSIAGDRWSVYDNKRDPINPTYRRLFPDGDIAESANTDADIYLLSNGFKITNDTGTSGAAQTYIYMAFSEESIVSSNGVPAVAR